MMQLDPHQLESVEWLLAHPRSGLADEMRVGKTAPAVVAASTAGAERVLVLCPAHVRAVWHDAVRTWGGTGEWKVVSYDSFASRQSRTKELTDWKPDTLILDECHYLKTKGAKRTRAVYGAGCHGSDLLEHAARVWLLSGTPCPNGPHELWTHWHAVFDDPLSYYEWVRRYCNITHTEHGVKVLGVRKIALPELQRKFRERFIRRRFKDVHGTDTLVWNVVPVEMPRNSQGGLFRDVGELLRSSAYRKASFEADQGEAAEGAKECLATLRRLTAEHKAGVTVQHVREYLEDPAARVLVFGHHREALGRIAEDLSYVWKIPTVLVRGGTEDAKKQEAVRRFQSGEARVFVGQITSCGSGIDLSAATAVVFAETEWTPGENVQAAMRSQHRDKKHPVPVDVLVWEGSLDEAVERTKLRKLRMLRDTYDERED